MAVILEAPYGDPTLYDKYFLEAYEPEDLERIKARKIWQEEEFTNYMQVIRPAKKKQFFRRFHELPMKAEFMVKKLRFRKGKRIGDYVQSSTAGTLVSEKVKGIIEAIEPNAEGHQFFPVEITHKDGSAYDGQYYVWQVHRKLDALNPASKGLKAYSSDVETTAYSRASGYSSTRDNVSVYKDRINSYAAWYDVRFSKQAFISDAVFHALEAAEIKGYSIDSEWAEI